MPKTPPAPGAPAPGATYDIPASGSLGLLALGWRGLAAWREARGTGWLDERRAEQDVARAALRARRRAAGSPALDGIDVTVVTGLPRSGTSLVMQMLAAGGLAPATDGARVPDASNPRGYYEHARVLELAAGADAGWMAAADGRALKVVAPLVPRLPTGPRYTFVLVERDMAEVLASQRSMLERLGTPASASDARLAAAYQRHLDEARAFAAAEGRLVVLQHRALVADAPGEAARLATFLPALDAAAMAAAVDPTLYRERA